MSMHRSTIRMAAGVVACTTLLAGCGDANADRAGGNQGDDTVVLTFSNPFSSDEFPPPGREYAAQVEALTGGTVQFELTGNSREGDIEAQPKMIEDVRVGTIDMAIVGVRAFDSLDVNSFDALMAPMLIDSYELEQAVFEAGIPEQMLTSLDETGVVGVAVLPAALSRILGTTHPFATVDDFADQTVYAQNSDVGSQTYAALGAATAPWPPGAPINDFDAMTTPLGAIWGRHWELVADSVTTNVILLGGGLVVIINPDVFDSLNEDQQAALRTAATATVPTLIQTSRDEDREALDALCSTDLRFVTATDDQLVEIRTALEPVYADLASDPQTADYLEEIAALKQELGALPDSPACEQSPTVATGESALNGTYITTLTGEDILASGCDSPAFAQATPDVVVTQQLTLNDGQVEQLNSINGGDFEPGFIGTYSVFRDRIELRDPVGPVNFAWSLEGTNLVFSDPAADAPCDGVVVWTTHPWVLVDEATSESTDGARTADATQASS